MEFSASGEWAAKSRMASKLPNSNPEELLELRTSSGYTDQRDEAWQEPGQNQTHYSRDENTRPVSARFIAPRKPRDREKEPDNSEQVQNANRGQKETGIHWEYGNQRPELEKHECCPRQEPDREE